MSRAARRQSSEAANHATPGAQGRAHAFRRPELHASLGVPAPAPVHGGTAFSHTCRRFASACCLAALVICGLQPLAGCARTRIAEPFDVNARPGLLESEMAYWGEMADRPAVSNNEALHGLFLFAEGADPARSWEDRLALAKEREWVGDSFDEDPDLAIQRGTLARAVAVICGIDGGVMMRLLGPMPRYALRELIWEGIIPGGTGNQTITGLEFVGVVSKAQDYMVRNEIPFGEPRIGR